MASVWWLFALVITSSYTANLATLLASKSSTDLIHNVEELANNNLGIKYGAKKGGSTYNFFKVKTTLSHYSTLCIYVYLSLYRSYRASIAQ